jgi:hypothetical protein
MSVVAQSKDRRLEVALLTVEVRQQALAEDPQGVCDSLPGWIAVELRSNVAP